MLEPPPHQPLFKNSVTQIHFVPTCKSNKINDQILALFPRNRNRCAPAYALFSDATHLARNNKVCVYSYGKCLNCGTAEMLIVTRIMTRLDRRIY